MKALAKGLRAWQGVSFRTKVRLSPRRNGTIPDKIFFVHVPKCAGTTVSNYMKTYIGSAKSGRTLFYNDIFSAQEYSALAAEKLRRAHAAQFVSGHFSWRVIEELGTASRSFVFTFLRDPVARLLSLYNYAAAMPPGLLKTHIEGLHGIDADAFFLSEDHRIRHALDNYVTRQLAGRFEQSLWDDDDENPATLTSAIRNLHSLDFVGTVEQFSPDFAALVTQLGLPKPRQMPQANVTGRILSHSGRHARSLSGLSSAAREMIERYTRYDRKLFEIAKRTARDIWIASLTLLAMATDWMGDAFSTIAWI